MTSNGHHKTVTVICPRCGTATRRTAAWVVAVTCDCGCQYEAHPGPRAGSGPARDET